MRHQISSFLVALFTSLTMLSASAEQSQSFDDYTIHYNAITTDMLDPAVAKNYNILRSKYRALLNISVLKNISATSTLPVKAGVEVSSKNLTAQLREINIREVVDGEAIYYLGEFPVANEETLLFNIEVQPESVDQTYHLNFQQQFFID